MPVVVLSGMRQTGKSTFLQEELELRSRRYITLDDFAQLAAAKEDPDQFVATDETLIIDEAQRCPELLTAIKRAVDRKRSPGQFILSGSANFLLMKNISESLAGRAAYFTMNPFSRRELNGKIKDTPFIKSFFGEQTIKGLSDAGIACFLSGVELLTADNPLKGAMIETYVAQNLVAILNSAWPKANLFFWNIQGRHEVDFIIEAENRCIAIEVKAAARWEKEDLASLKSFVAATPHCMAGILAYNGTTPVTLGNKLWAIPLELLLS